ncbi:alpha/beta hydrolase [Sandaracinus amylolyticus]|uniref:alpha/beta hydrolase n=1 Tax=Sandaracinus amylolyticus TaxID=927083 RepID=UPI001F237D61|nr:alpha/beta fold hydrolase [Sandaracinus amylolyticus]
MSHLSPSFVRIVTSAPALEAALDEHVCSAPGFYELVDAFGEGSSLRVDALQSAIRAIPGASAARIAIAATRTPALVCALGAAREIREKARAQLGALSPRIARPVRPLRPEPTPWEQRTCRVGSLRVRYVDVGTARAGTVLLVHGHASSLEEGTALIEALCARGFRVLAPDLPWCGYSDAPAELPRATSDRRAPIIDLYVEVCQRFLHAVGVTGDVIGMGGSLGGNVVFRLAHAAPRRFPRNVVWSPGSAWREPPGGEETLLMFAWPDRAGENGFIEWSVTRQGGHWYGPHFPDAARDRALREAELYRRERYSRDFHLAWLYVAIQQLATSLHDIADDVRAEMVILAGEHDVGMGLHEETELLAKKVACLRNADVGHPEVRVARCGHSLHNEMPEALADHAAKLAALR